MRRGPFFTVVLASLALAAACRSARFPAQHREVALACPTTPRAAGWNNPNPDAGSSGKCERDADCTAGKNGRCSLPGHAESICTYDECSSDGDCAAGKVCECSPYAGNHCLTANCRTDADCGGLGCSPTRPEMCGNMAGTAGWYCHTKKDECVEDSDCKTKGDTAGMCVYSPAGARWTCNYDTCVG